MNLTTLLNRVHRHKGFVYGQAEFIGSRRNAIEVPVRPRAGSAAICSGCGKPAPGYDQQPARRFEFIPAWGILVFFLYSMRRVNCPRCPRVVVEQVPWAEGKHPLTTAYMQYLARWARRLSWKETAEAFHTTWDTVHHSVEWIVEWGLKNRVLGAIQAIGVDEIAYAKGHKYLTLVFQIEAGMTRLLWVGRDRTVASFRVFFAMIGELSASMRDRQA